MLMTIGNVYSDKKENFDMLVEALENEGFEIAYNESLISGVILKEVEVELGDQEA